MSVTKAKTNLSLAVEWCALNVLVPLIAWVVLPTRQHPELSALFFALVMCAVLGFGVRFFVTNFRSKPVLLWLGMTGTALLQLVVAFFGLLMLFLWYVGEG
jgi:hypothetical protein